MFTVAPMTITTAKLIQDAREAQGLGVRAAVRRPGTSSGHLSMIENGKRGMPKALERGWLHTIALGTRSPLEEERDMDPHFAIAIDFTGGPAWLAADDEDRIPIFFDAVRAAITALGLEELRVGRKVMVVPTWANGVAGAVMRRRFPDGVPPASMSEDDAAKLADEIAESVYVVEAQVAGPDEADAFARALAPRILAGITRRSAEAIGEAAKRN